MMNLLGTAMPSVIDKHKIKVDFWMLITFLRNNLRITIKVTIILEIVLKF